MSVWTARAWPPDSLPALTPGPPLDPGSIQTIVVVEDNRDAADTLRDLLELWGYQVTVAYTGPAGVAAVRQVQPDLVLCDLGLPGCTGFDVARQIRADSQVGRVRLCAVTGQGSAQDQRESRAAGFDRHVTKPLALETLEKLLLRR